MKHLILNQYIKFFRGTAHADGQFNGPGHFMGMIHHREHGGHGEGFEKKGFYLCSPRTPWLIFIQIGRNDDKGPSGNCLIRDPARSTSLLLHCQGLQWLLLPKPAVVGLYIFRISR